MAAYLIVHLLAMCHPLTLVNMPCKRFCFCWCSMLGFMLLTSHRLLFDCYKRHVLQDIEMMGEFGYLIQSKAAVCFFEDWSLGTTTWR